jgi:hypothetical protein
VKVFGERPVGLIYAVHLLVYACVEITQADVVLREHDSDRELSLVFDLLVDSGRDLSDGRGASELRRAVHRRALYLDRISHEKVLILAFAQVEEE